MANELPIESARALDAVQAEPSGAETVASACAGSTIEAMALLDFLNPFTWLAHLRGERELEIAEERFHADKAAKLGARYERGEPPQPSRSSISSAFTGTTYGPWSVRHVFLLACAGPWYADEVTLWLAYGEHFEVRRTEEQSLGLLRPSDPERKVEFVETEFSGGRVPRDGALMCRWTDGNGTHLESLLGITVWI